MQSYHWLMLVLIFVAGVAAQKYFNLSGKVGL
jgi:hypothetical protein